MSFRNSVEVPWFHWKIEFSMFVAFTMGKIMVFSIAMLDSHRVNNLVRKLTHQKLFWCSRFVPGRKGKKLKKKNNRAMGHPFAYRHPFMIGFCNLLQKSGVFFIPYWRSATANDYGTHDTWTVWKMSSVPVTVQEAVNQLATTQARLPACLACKLLMDLCCTLMSGCKKIVIFDGLMVDNGR